MQRHGVHVRPRRCCCSRPCPTRSLVGGPTRAASYAHRSPPSTNTGLTSALDLDISGGIAGGGEAATLASNNGSVNQGHLGDPAHDTANFNDTVPGEPRVDYVLPSANLGIAGAGIFRPTFRGPCDLYANYSTSDHELVWVDVSPPLPEPWALLTVGLGPTGRIARPRQVRRNIPM